MKTIVSFIFVSLLVLGLLGTASANEGDDLATLQTDMIAKASQQYGATVKNISAGQGSDANQYQEVVQALNQQVSAPVLAGASSDSEATPEEDGKSAKGVIVFVSLGMPPEVLRQIFMEAHQLQIPVVVRGVLHNNFKESAQVLFSLLHPANQPPIEGGVEIDPLWFKEFDITQVPAVVAIGAASSCFGPSCKTPPYDIVYGNIPIPKALKMIADEGGAASPVARQCLAQLGGNADAY